MTSHYLTIIYDGTEQTEVRANDVAGGHKALCLPGPLDIHGPRDYLVRLLRASLEALTDGTVAWGPDGAEVVPLDRPTVRREADGAA